MRVILLSLAPRFSVTFDRNKLRAQTEIKASSACSQQGIDGWVKIAQVILYYKLHNFLFNMPI